MVQELPEDLSKNKMADSAKITREPKGEIIIGTRKLRRSSRRKAKNEIRPKQRTRRMGNHWDRLVKNRELRRQRDHPN